MTENPPPAPSGAKPGPLRARIRLEPFPPSELRAYLDELIVGYAEDHVRDGQWTAEEAPARSRAEVDHLLPQGADTPDHFLRAIVSDEDGRTVGRLWYHVAREGRPSLFIYDLLVFESDRGRGYGEAALRALEPIARELGVPRIALHVFGHNTGAIRLYDRIGYRPTNLLMSKDLTAP